MEKFLAFPPSFHTKKSVGACAYLFLSCQLRECPFHYRPCRGVAGILKGEGKLGDTSKLERLHALHEVVHTATLSTLVARGPQL